MICVLMDKMTTSLQSKKLGRNWAEGSSVNRPYNFLSHGIAVWQMSSNTVQRNGERKSNGIWTITFTHPSGHLKMLEMLMKRSFSRLYSANWEIDGKFISRQNRVWIIYNRFYKFYGQLGHSSSKGLGSLQSYDSKSNIGSDILRTFRHISDFSMYLVLGAKLRNEYVAIKIFRVMTQASQFFIESSNYKISFSSEGFKKAYLFRTIGPRSTLATGPFYIFDAT